MSIIDQSTNKIHFQLAWLWLHDEQVLNKTTTTSVYFSIDLLNELNEQVEVSFEVLKVSNQTKCLNVCSNNGDVNY